MRLSYGAAGLLAYEEGLRVEAEVRKASNRHIVRATLPGKRAVAGISEALRDYIQGLFTREPGLSAAQFEDYLADCPASRQQKQLGARSPLQSEI